MSGSGKTQTARKLAAISWRWKMKTLEQHWLGYRQEVLPLNASEVQVTECRRAFIAGATSLALAFDEVAELGGAAGSDIGTAALEDLLSEMDHMKWAEISKGSSQC
jgi:hypothetical protein